MNLTTLFDRITNKQKQRHDARVADYRSLVAQIADGQEPDPAQIDELLTAHGKTIEDLKTDVELYNLRRAWRRQLDALPMLAKEKARLEKQIAEADKVFQSAEERHDEVTAPLYYRLGAIKEDMRLGTLARNELQRTCSDPELLAELDSIRADHTRAHDRLMGMQLEIRQSRETAESDRAEARRQTWPTETARLLEHAEALDERRKELEPQVPEAQQAVADLERREKELRERMLTV